MLRFALGDYILRITKKRMLQMQGKKWLNWLHSVLGRFSTDFRKLLQGYALNICCFNPGQGSFSKSKPQSSLGTMQAWFLMGKPICGPGSCVLPHAYWFSKPGLSYIRHCHVDQSPTLDFYFFFFCKKKFLKILFIFGERGREGEIKGKKHPCERETFIWERKIDQLPLKHTPNWGLNLQPRHVPWQGIELATCCFTGLHPSNWATLVRSTLDFFN